MRPLVHQSVTLSFTLIKKVRRDRMTQQKTQKRWGPGKFYFVTLYRKAHLDVAWSSPDPILASVKFHSGLFSRYLVS